MTNFNIKLAEKIISVNSLFPSTREFCQDYLTGETPEFFITITEEDILEERSLNAKQMELEGNLQSDFSDEYIETLALYRKITSELLKSNVLLMHGCAIACDGKAYIFTAKSGTGKTTHARLWLENIPGSYILNGDKPLLLVKDDEVLVCGTPWMGKEHLGTREDLPLAAICYLERDTHNHIEQLTFKESYASLLSQLHFPKGDTVLSVMNLVKKMSNINYFHLGCNMDSEAAFVSHDAMTGTCYSIYRYFLCVLYDHINDKSSMPPGSDDDWDAIMELARKHQVEGIVNNQCKDFLPGNYKTSFRESYIATLYYYSNRVQEEETIFNIFKEKGLDFFTVKGLDVASCYPVPALRTMGDSDVILRGDDREAAHEILTELGYECSRKYNDSEWGYSKKGLDFELHDRLLYNENFIDESHIEYFNDCWSHVKDGKLDDDFHFLFLIYHLRKHILFSGVGFRQFMDIVLFAKNKSINYDYVKEVLEKLQIFDFAKILFALNEAWFGVTSPYEKPDDFDSFFAEATIAVFKNGIFGFENSDNDKAKKINRQLSEGNVSKAFIRKVFPSYAELKRHPAYSKIDGKPYLLPFFWVYRFVRSLFSKNRKENYKSLSIPMINDDEVSSRVEYLKKWKIM